MGMLDGRVALVTGAARGIGAAIAKRLAADGARVVVNYSTSAKPAGETVAAIAGAGGQAVAVQGDVSNPAAVTGLFDAAERWFGPVAILVNNAGVHETRPVEQADAAHFEKVFRANVLGTLLATAEFARRFRGGPGRVVNISSRAARSALPGWAVYCASKAAVEGLTRGHAVDLGAKGITVNAVGPRHDRHRDAPRRAARGAEGADDRQHGPRPAWHARGHRRRRRLRLLRRRPVDHRAVPRRQRRAPHLTQRNSAQRHVGVARPGDQSTSQGWPPAPPGRRPVSPGPVCGGRAGRHRPRRRVPGLLRQQMAHSEAIDATCSRRLKC